MLLLSQATRPWGTYPNDGGGLEADPVEVGHQPRPVRQHEEQDHRAHEAESGMHPALNPRRRQVLPVAGQGEAGEEASGAAVPAPEEVAVVVMVAIIGVEAPWEGRKIVQPAPAALERLRASS